MGDAHLMRHGMSLGGAAALVAGLALLATACGASASASFEARVNDALKDARIDHVAPVWDAERNALRLTGIVLTADEKQRAADVAASALGGRADILNDITVTMRGAPAPAPAVARFDDLERIDERVARDVEALFADQRVWKGRKINVMVRNGTVRLTGTALSQADKDRITELVARVAGVKEVVNRLDLEPGG